LQVCNSKVKRGNETEKESEALSIESGITTVPVRSWPVRAPCRPVLMSLKLGELRYATPAEFTTVTVVCSGAEAETGFPQFGASVFPGMVTRSQLSTNGSFPKKLIPTAADS